MRWPLLVILVVAVGVGVWTLRGQDSVHASTGAATTQSPAVPVTVVPANVRDVPGYLRGLGTVQAFNVVGVKAKVNGMLIAIPAQEGQEVHQGDARPA
jgi:membrane fusion protein, multidrug efflux system